MSMRWTPCLCLLVLGCDPDRSGDGGTDGSSSSEGETSAASDPSTTGDPAPTTTSSTSASTEAGSSSEGSDSSSSSGETTTADPNCDAFEPGDAFEIAAGTYATRIHPHAAGDDTGAWFSFVHLEPVGSLFDVSVMHLRCAEVVDVEPVQLTTEPGNDIDASVAVSGERVLVAWNTDDGAGGDSNLQIHGRILDLDGTPTADAQFRVTTAVEGEPITQNHTFGIVTAAAHGFTVAGLRAHPDSPAFVAFRQALDPEGVLLDEAFGPPVEMGVSHLGASASADWLAYARSDDSSDEVWLARPDQAAAAAFGGMTATPGQVLSRADAPDAPIVVAALGEGNDLDLGLALGVEAPTLVGDAGSIEHNPTVAMNADGDLAIVFHRNLGGLNNAVVFQRLTIEGEAVVTLGEELELDTMSPPYPPSITWTPGGWLVTWSRGQSPDFTTWGRVLSTD